MLLANSKVMRSAGCDAAVGFAVLLKRHTLSRTGARTAAMLTKFNLHTRL
jgi:hypothetical protein